MKIKFEEQFDEFVLKQGKACFEDGAITHMFNDKDDYKGYFQDDERYLVKVSIKDGICIAKSCDCPTEEACEHEAALLYSLQDNEELELMEQARYSTLKDQRIHEVLRQCTKEELMLIVENGKNNRS